MNKNQVEKELFNKYNSHPILGSWLLFLKSCYEVASERKQYQRCSIIQDLIIEDINS